MYAIYLFAERETVYRPENLWADWQGGHVRTGHSIR